MKVLKRILTATGILLGIVLVWGLIEPYLLDVEEFTVAVPNLPERWEGQRFAQLSDWQLGMWGDNESTVRRAVERLVELRLAFVVITGDFVYHAGSEPGEVLGQVAGIARALPQAGIPTYALLGNHDWGMRKKKSDPDEDLARQVESALEEIGIPVLQNEVVQLQAPEAGHRDGSRRDRAPLYLAGIGANWPDKDRPAATVALIPEGAARIVMMHNPQSFPDLPAGAAPLALAGHTHGGQMRLPFTSRWSYLELVRPEEMHADGWIEEAFGQAGNRLYVNRGIGFSAVPLRIHCMPELTLFTLSRGESAPVGDAPLEYGGKRLRVRHKGETPASAASRRELLLELRLP